VHLGRDVKYPLFLSDFNETLLSSTNLPQKTQIPNFMKISPEGAELFRVGVQTDIIELTVSFRQFCERA